MRTTQLLQTFATLSLSLSILSIAPEAEGQVKKQSVQYRGMSYGGDSATDLQDLRSIGANIVVYQLGIPANLIDGQPVETYRTLLNDKLSRLDVLVDLCGTIGLKMLIVLSSPPGGAISTKNPPVQRAFLQKEYQDELTATWQTLTSRYAGKPGILGFDLLNEPQDKGTAAGLLAWRELAPKLIQAIHAIDPTRAIYIEPPYGNPDQIRTRTALIKDPLVSYNVHTYFPSNFRNQGLNGRKINVEYPKGALNKARLKQALSKVITFQRKNKVNIIVGEFAAPRWAPKNSSVRLLRDYISIFESQKWDWALHAWREADVWSIEHSDNPKDPNPTTVKTARRLLIEKYFAKNG